MPRQLRIGTLLLLAIIQWDLVGCGPRMTPPTAQLAVQPTDATVVPPVAATNTPDPLLVPPPTTVPEELLGDTIDHDAPTITVPVTITKAALAAELYTTPALLDYFTQGLPDPVPQNYIVVVPRIYLAETGETLTSIADGLGLPVTILGVVNPDLPLDTPFGSATQIRLPRLYTTPTASTLAEIAASLSTTVEVLISVNPALQPDQMIPAGQLLVIPLSR